MTLFLLVVAIVIIIYLLRTRNKQQGYDLASENPSISEVSLRGSRQSWNDGTTGVTAHYRPAPNVAVDLRDDADRVFRVVATSHWVEADTMGRYAADYFFLHREPDNEYDANAVAVYGGDRKFGYLEAAAAAEYAPLFDQVGSDFIVARDQTYYGGDQFRLPHVPILRKIIDDGPPPYWNSGP